MTTPSQASFFIEDATTERSEKSAVPKSDIVLTGRNVEIPDHFRVYVSDKLARLEHFDPSIFRFNVELQHERNPRQSKTAQRVEITARGKGPVARAEASADSFYAAFEAVIAKLENRLRRTKGRKRVSYGDKRPVSVSEATAPLALETAPTMETDISLNGQELEAYDGPGQVVRVKDHPAEPMLIDDALYEMELVGHDFFLFHDKESDKPSVVYRRHAFDYGLIRLT
ncbi:ribosomal subunit interface protein [Rhodococcus sp. SRB_17]|uniref:ribosome hibernation-promoting factor, HPF/YfiA family n=1 Tax=Rhodococcus sp. OK302 TaxID=1882769 RepID=UPI000B93ADF1|nr:ribosome-associated translation inhibitor RaiA [Rhodococcus sp. OK302]NMM84179.1 ribosomal subunit interface protein [Rhodococcus sp. SRB_17]OYD69189.1 SSU ribosomal protein S30P /sigma 54 modulation protein [Rhodococcus sp. OK302]